MQRKPTKSIKLKGKKKNSKKRKSPSKSTDNGESKKNEVRNFKFRFHNLYLNFK